MGFAFVTYADAVFSRRLAGTPLTNGDQVVYTSSYLSIFCAIFAAGALGSINLTLLQKSRFSRQGDSKPHSSTSNEAQENGSYHDNNASGEIRPEAIQPAATTSASKKTRLGIPDAVVMLATASLFYSMLSLVIGLLVFIWGEHPRRISITITVIVALYLPCFFLYPSLVAEFAFFPSSILMRQRDKPTSKEQHA